MEPTPREIIDADIHPVVRGLRPLAPYLPDAWREHFVDRAGMPSPVLTAPLPGRNVNRSDATAPDGSPPGTSPSFMRTDLLDRYGIAQAVMLSAQAGRVTTMSNPDDARMLVRAYNEYFLSEWVPVDRRYLLAITVAPHDPTDAAAEIRRLAQHEAVVAIYLPMTNRRFGNSYFYPIYDAAQECGLPVCIHPNGAEGEYQPSAAFAMAPPSSYTERHSSWPELAVAGLTSLMFEGVFERFPGLRVVFAEFGYAWVPGLLWRMDKNWRGFRREVPWCRRPPSEYVLERVRFTSQPVEEPERPEFLSAILEMLHAERTLLFATDYPHWDADPPERVYNQLSPELQRRIFSANARELFRLPRPVTPDVATG